MFPPRIVFYLTILKLVKAGERDSEEFQFVKPEPANELGIFPKVIAQIEREALKTVEIWRINKAFTTEEVFDRLAHMCDNNEEKAYITWTDCALKDEGLFARVTSGVPEKKNKTLTYFAVDFKPFTRVGKNGMKEVCALDEVYYQTVYFVLKTYSEIPSNKTFPRTPIQSVATVHQHELDAFGSALSIFEESIVDLESVYNFGKKEYYHRHPPYECFVAIGSGQSIFVIEEKCSFFCLEEVEKSDKEFRELLEKHRDQEQEDEDEEDWVVNEHGHQEL